MREPVYIDVSKVPLKEREAAMQLRDVGATVVKTGRMEYLVTLAGFPDVTARVAGGGRWRCHLRVKDGATDADWVHIGIPSVGYSIPGCFGREQAFLFAILHIPHWRDYAFVGVGYKVHQLQTKLEEMDALRGEIQRGVGRLSDGHRRLIEDALASVNKRDPVEALSKMESVSEVITEASA